MAVARPELMPAELVWVADRLRAGGEIPRDMRRAVREIERQRDRALAQERREIAHSRRMRETFLTDPDRAREETSVSKHWLFPNGEEGA